MHPGPRFSHWKFIAQAKVRRTLSSVSPYRESSHQRFPSSSRRPFPLSLFFLSFYLSFLLPIGRRPTSPPGYEILWEPKRFSRPEFSLLRSPMNLDRPIVERDILDFFFSVVQSLFFFFLILLFAESTRKEWSNGRIGQNYFFFFRAYYGDLRKQYCFLLLNICIFLLINN